MFSNRRVVLARKRRRTTAKALAAAAGISAVHLSRIEGGISEPGRETQERLAAALRYPLAFFFLPDPPELDADAVSFRSLKATSVRERDAAIAAGEIGVEVASWLDRNFNLPAPGLPDFGYLEDPEVVARALRQEWGLGERPIGSTIALLESKGVRVFSLAEDSKNVDAFSFWLDGVPYAFLNTMKTAEHGMMDAAHELGHLVMHRSGVPRGRDPEREAKAFASAFLLPKEDVIGRIPSAANSGTLIRAKSRWRCSAMALAHRCHGLGLLSDWQYRTACIELTQLGYRTGEPGGIERDTSAVWRQVIGYLWKEKLTKGHLAAEIGIPIDELEKLTFGLTGSAPRPDGRSSGLSVVKSEPT